MSVEDRYDEELRRHVPHIENLETRANLPDEDVRTEVKPLVHEHEWVPMDASQNPCTVGCIGCGLWADVIDGQVVEFRQPEPPKP